MRMCHQRDNATSKNGQGMAEADPASGRQQWWCHYPPTAITGWYPPTATIGLTPVPVRITHLTY